MSEREKLIAILRQSVVPYFAEEIAEEQPNHQRAGSGPQGKRRRNFHMTEKVPEKGSKRDRGQRRKRPVFRSLRWFFRPFVPGISPRNPLCEKNDEYDTQRIRTSVSPYRIFAFVSD